VSNLPTPATSTEMYLAALLEQMAAIGESLAAIADALAQPDDTAPVDTVQLRESLLAIKGIGPSTADEILRKLLDR
jgi:endonuclease III-like uncharacterized protein